MQSARKSRSRFWSCTRGAGIAALALALAGWLYVVESAWTTRYWQSQLEEAPDDEIKSLAARITASGDEGLDALVACLGSSKESVRREVRLALDDELNRWARMPNREASARLGRLAAALAETEELDPASRWFAADLATRILLWPTDGGIVDRSRLVAQCEQVLRASRTARDREADRWKRADDVVQSEKAAAERRISSAPWATGEPPPESLRAPVLPPMLAGLQDTDEPLAVADNAEPQRLAPQAAAQLNPVATAKKPAESNPLRAAANQPAQAADEPAAQAGWSDPMKGPADPASAAGDPGRFNKTAMGELFAELASSGNTQTSAAATAELTRRGFSRREIEVGKHLTSVDAEERRRWTEALPGMRGIDAKGWLLLLSRDENSGVRRAAVTLMATSQDPQMLGRVGEVARDDADLALREQAARILEDNSKTMPAGFTR